MSQTQKTSNSSSTTGIPRWVKASGIIVIVLVTVFIALHLTGNSLGGPGMHTPPVVQGVQQP